MPRRKQTTIKLDDMKIYPTLIEELRNNPTYSDKDFATLKLTVLDSYEVSIKDVDKAIISLQRYLSPNVNHMDMQRLYHSPEIQTPAKC